jgi:hypothetical protein
MPERVAGTAGLVTPPAHAAAVFAEVEPELAALHPEALLEPNLSIPDAAVRVLSVFPTIQSMLPRAASGREPAAGSTTSELGVAPHPATPPILRAGVPSEATPAVVVSARTGPTGAARPIPQGSRRTRRFVR